MTTRSLSRLIALSVLAAGLLSGCSSDGGTAPNQSLALALGGTGEGSVTSTPAGISCTLAGGNQSGACTASFEADAVVNLSTAASAGNTFAGWVAGCTGAGVCTVVMNQSRAVTGAFAPVLHPLTLTPTGNGSGTIVSNPAGISCVSLGGTAAGVCTASFRAGAVVTLTQTANVTSTFTGWAGGCAGAGACQVTVNAATTVSSGFQLINYPVTIAPNGNGSGSVQSTPAGITCTVTGGVAGGTCTGDFPVGTVVTLTPTSGATSSFGGWSGSCSGNGNCQLVADGAKPVTASFSQLVYPVSVSGGGTGSGTVTSAPAGISCTITNGVATGGTCQASFPAGIAVGLTATPAANQSFSGWGGSCTGGGACALTMNGSRAVTASFTPQTFSISVGPSSGTGSGTITSVPAGINCSILNGSSVGACSANFNPNVVVTLTATATGASSFTGWGGACSGLGTCQLPPLDGNKTVTAGFGAVVLHPVTIAGGGTGSGTVSSSPSGINGCVITNGVAAASGCSASFPQGTSLTLSVTPNPNSGFTGWAGPCTGAGSCQFAVNAPATATASFTQGAFTLSVTGTGNGTGTVTSNPAGINCTIASGVAVSGCSSSFATGANVILTATASGGGHSFSGWGPPCAGTGTCQITMSGPQTVSAAFTTGSGIFSISPDFRVLSPGQAVALTARAPDGSAAAAPPVTTSSSAPGVASVTGLVVNAASSGVTDITATLNAATDQSRIAVVASDGMAIIVTRAQDSAFMNVNAGATFALDVWVIRPSGGSGDLGSIQGAIGWDASKFQYVSVAPLAAGWSVLPNESGTGSGNLGFGAFNVVGTSGTFALARLTLRAIGGSSTSAVTPAVTAAGTSLGVNVLGKIVAVPSSLRIP